MGAARGVDNDRLAELLAAMLGPVTEEAAARPAPGSGAAAE
ncbi:hypothetical protein [Kitasatospora indigofera]